MSIDKSLEKVLKNLKDNYENAIKIGGRKKYTSLIRSQGLINLFHEYLKHKLMESGVASSKIYPEPGKSRPEIKMSGMLKQKNQDICVLPSKPTKKEIIQEGWQQLVKVKDNIGLELTKKSISINVRSQLSSLAKNFDTLYERTFAEALNLHLRVPKLIMGELYVVPLQAYDPDKAKNYEISFKEKLPLKYIPAFDFINRRSSENDEPYKYEKVALMIIDFRNNPPSIVESLNVFRKEGYEISPLLKNDALVNLSIRTFISDLLEIYEKRHGSLDPIF
ncbi:MAG: restriction endonuclease [Candidatus Hermodarchaeota archaeon]